MVAKIKNYLFEPKSKIGWVHGTITILGATILAYLTMMIYSKFMVGDYGIKIIPSMIITPILIACYSIWILFSNTIINAIFKVIFLSIVILIILKVF